MPAPAKHSEEKLLDRAVEQFWVAGYGATTIRDLERALDVTAPSIYHRWGGKDELFERAIAHYVATVIEPRIARYLGASDEPIVDLYRFFRTAQSPRGCMLTTAAVELGPRSSAVRTCVERGLDVMRAGLHGEAARLVERDLVPGPPADLAQTLLVDMQGLMVLSRLGLSSEELRRRTHLVFVAMCGDRFRPRR